MRVEAQVSAAAIAIDRLNDHQPPLSRWSRAAETEAILTELAESLTAIVRRGYSQSSPQVDYSPVIDGAGSRL